MPPVRPECGYCYDQDIKDVFGVQWTEGATFDALLLDLIEKASRLIDREVGWLDCHYAILDTLASARYYDCLSGREMRINRCLDGLHFTGAVTFALATSQITAAAGLQVFYTGETILINGSTSNDGIYTIATGAVAGVIVVNEALVNEGPTAGVTITSLVIAVDENADGTYTTWINGTDYVIWPYDEGWITKIIVKDDASKIFPQGQRLLRIHAKWGAFGTPPHVIQQACIITVSRWFKRGLQQFQDTGAIIEVGQLVYTKALDPDVVEILRVSARRIALG